MDKQYKKLKKNTQKLISQEDKILSQDEKRDKFVKAGKKALQKSKMHGKC